MPAPELQRMFPAGARVLVFDGCYTGEVLETEAVPQPCVRVKLDHDDSVMEVDPERVIQEEEL